MGQEYDNGSYWSEWLTRGDDTWGDSGLILEILRIHEQHCGEDYSFPILATVTGSINIASFYGESFDGDIVFPVLQSSSSLNWYALPNLEEIVGFSSVTGLDTINVDAWDGDDPIALSGFSSLTEIASLYVAGSISGFDVLSTAGSINILDNASRFIKYGGDVNLRNGDTVLRISNLLTRFGCLTWRVI